MDRSQEFAAMVAESPPQYFVSSTEGTDSSSGPRRRHVQSRKDQIGKDNRDLQQHDQVFDRNVDDGDRENNAATIDEHDNEYSTESDVHARDAFTDEAYRINEFISQMLRYFNSVKAAVSRREHRIDMLSKRSNATQQDMLSPEQYDEMLSESRRLVKQAMLRIQQLQTHEKAIRHYYSGKNIVQKLFRNPDQDAHLSTLAAHRSGIIAFLNERLAQVSKLQKKEQESYLQEQLKKNELSIVRPGVQRKQSSHNEKDPASFDTGLADRMRRSDKQKSVDQYFEEELSPEMRQNFEMQNMLLMNDYDSSVDKVRALEKSVSEISDLHVELINNLLYQNELSEQLYDSAVQSSSMITKGNQQLRRAKSRHARSTKFIVYGLLTLSLMLLFLDYFGSR